MAAAEINTDNIVMENYVPKVSVIVPAYNAEKYLERCLNSVVAQTMPDFECIVVDDGSIDRTGDIAEEYAKKDSRFKVIHQPNGGVSVARQAGIDAANGVYTIQFDADDWVEANMLEEMYSLAENKGADMVMCDINVISQSEDVIWSQKPKNLDTKTVLGQMMQQLCCSLWNKLIKRTCYQKHNIRFESGELSEDLLVCLSILSHPIIVEYISEALYHYDQTINSDSLTKKMNLSLARLKSFELFAAKEDISAVRDYYDNAILQTAFNSLFLTDNRQINYSKLYKKHILSIRQATGYPFRVKLLVLLRIYGIRIPIVPIKRLWLRIKSHTEKW